jgi:hypothetical protein
MDEIIRREKISEALRWRVLKRDHYRCRYCGRDTGPFHMDHVYPVVKGGETTSNNLVTACDKCNMHKHDAVGVYPLPIGYFDEPKPAAYPMPNIKMGTVILAGVWALMNYSYFADEGFTLAAVILFVFGVIVSHYGVIRLLTTRSNEIDNN